MNIENMRVEEFTSPLVITLESDATMDKALEIMQEHNIRHLPVLQNRDIVGVVSERDLLTHIGRSWDKELKVEDIMNTSVLFVHTNDNLGEVAYLLSSEKRGSAIVLDSDDELFGIFTTTDALNALVETFHPSAQEKSEFRD